jgi:ubiquinone/menaquinone biosynthesis C-methylase UbiE
MLSYVGAYFYDKIMRATEEACLIEWRRDLLKDVHGHVLEIGAGTGASLGLYPENADIKLHLTEPDKHMRTQLMHKLADSHFADAKVLACAAENIDSADHTYDCVFVSLVCCSVNDVPSALAEIKRVLKPSGRLLFLEHVAAPQGSQRRMWQNILNGPWGKLAGNCHLNRDTERSLLDAGFELEHITRESLRKAMPLVRPSIRGIARISKTT